MAVKSSLSVLIGATVGPLQKGLKKASGLVSDFSAKTSKLIAGPAGIGGAIGGALGGITVAAGIKYAVGQFSAIEQSSTRLASALQATGGQAGVSVREVTSFAQQLSQVTRFSADATIQAGAALAKFGQVKGPNFNETLKQAANYAAVMGKDLPGAASELGAALQSPREGYLALAAAGVRFSDAQIDSIQSMQAAGDIAGAQAVILQALDEQYKGAAEAAGGTLAGKLDILHNTFENVAAIVGEAVAPAIKTAADRLTSWLQSMDKNMIAAKSWDVMQSAVGFVADAIQVVEIAVRALQLGLTKMLQWSIQGFIKLVQGIEWAINGMRKLAGLDAMASSTKDLEAFAKGLDQVSGEQLDTLDKKIKAPWMHKDADKFFADVKKETDETKAKMEDMGKASADAIKSGPVAAMKQLTAIQIQAQTEATNLIKDLTLQNKYFGKDQYAQQAGKLADKGATKGQVEQVKKLGAQLQGKQLAESLETPFEKFEREMKKLSDLKAAGGISDETFGRARAKLTKDLQTSIPEQKVSAGGALSFGSAEARSALINYRGAQRNASPQAQMQRVLDTQLEEQRLSRIYLKQLVDAKSGLAAAPVF